MTFQGFSPEAEAFLWELSFHNERPWFLEHKEQFEAAVNRPFRAACSETLSLMRERYPERDFEAHISRIYRDARRLFGRGPYKDNLWFTLYEAPQRNQGPAFWFELGRTGCSAGVGFWDASPAMMEEYRRRIDANPARFERILDGIGPDWTLWGVPYKRPKGERGALINPYYNRRYLMLSVEKDFGGDALSPQLPQLLTGTYEELFPMYDFFWDCWRSAV